jgi:sugar transferase EpsL
LRAYREFLSIAPTINPPVVSRWALSRRKRLLDILLAASLLLALSPVLALVALAVRWQLGRPVLFRQRRPGLNGAEFHLLKFRSMRNCRNGVGELLSDADRLTSFGRWLRASSLDELPELLNVIRGQMSLVGPRPLLPEYLPLYSPEQARRHLVRPGLTGWAQVNGRNELGWDERFQLDVWYVNHASLWHDLYILARTMLDVVSRRGISEPGSATMSPFRGAQ